MCGIVGMWEKRKYAEKLAEYWTLLKHRGTDSYGVLIKFKNCNTVKVIKSINKDLVINKLKEIEENANIQWILAHNRKASVGSVIESLAHPIINTKYKNIIIHNGTKREVVELFSDYASDTEALLNSIRILKYDKELLRQLLDKTGVIFYFEDKYLIFHKSNRSLYINREKKILASIPVDNGNWNKVKNTDYKFIILKEDEIPFLNLYTENESVNYNLKLCNICKTKFFGTDSDIRCPECEKILNKTYKGGNYKW